MAISFLSEEWQPQHITIGLFEANETIRQAMASNLIELLDQYDVMKKKIIAYVKDESANLNVMTTTFKSMVNCEVFGMEKSFQGTCFGHAVF